ncbi:MAG: glycoside hydrolase family 9 protein [Fibrobacterota bacterium]|nr:glycoside hydrolase family 9 protein [Chitinispirillaceae bacterium]
MSKFLLLLVLFYALVVSADPFIRYNQAGYVPDREKTLIVMSGQDLKNKPWVIKRKNVVVLRGTIPASIEGIGAHTSHPFNHEIDFSSLKTIGDYDFSIGKTHSLIHITPDPYSVFITDALRHLKTVRSGTTDALNHSFSHGGDSASTVYRIEGDPLDGKWVEAAPHMTVDALGGWYDAGDFIKFTLTIANVVYYLLEAYEANPMAFTKVISGSDLPDVLDEAQFGLSYLLKTHPASDLFIIQVGEEKDHWQNQRLPENDALNGKRPALCAISPTHMGLTAAALAKGARIFKALGRDSIAGVYLSKAKEIFSRAQQSDALKKTAYLKGEFNDFYRDDMAEDNMGLGAAELFVTTADSTYLKAANSIFPLKQTYWLAWPNYNFSANKTFAPYSLQSKTDAFNEILYYTDQMDPVWGIPLTYVWGSIHCWNGVGAAAAELNRIVTTPKAQELHLKMVDLLFGRNNWGLSFIASPRLPNAIHSCYNPVYRLNRIFPLGAVSLGPADWGTYNGLVNDMGQPPASMLDSFQTSTALYYDYNRAYLFNETSIVSQVSFIWMLAMACDTVNQAKPDSSIPSITTIPPVEQSTYTFAPSYNSWFTFSDAAYDGNSVAQWVNTASHTISLQANEGFQFAYVGYGFKLLEEMQDWSHYDAIRLHGYFEKNEAFYLGLQMPEVTDEDFHGQFFLGNGDSVVQIAFSEADQIGWGNDVTFNTSKIVSVNLEYYNTLKPATVRIDSVSLIRFGKHHHVPVKPHCLRKPNGNKHFIRKDLKVHWMHSKATELCLQNFKGRTLWKKMVLPGQVVTLPKFKGCQMLVSNGQLLDKWINH